MSQMPEVNILEMVALEVMPVELLKLSPVQPYEALTDAEKAHLAFFYNLVYKQLVPRSTVLADIWKRAYDAKLMETMVGMVKAQWKKAFAGIFPGTDQIGIKSISPFDIRYVTTPTAENPAYSDYLLNLWELDLTAGKPIFLLGATGEWYRSKPIEGERTLLVILALIERGTTPAINQLKIEGEELGIPRLYAIQPYVDVTVEKEEALYVYELPGALPVTWKYGVRLSGMPIYTGRRNIPMLGFTLYEKRYYTDLVWRT